MLTSPAPQEKKKKKRREKSANNKGVENSTMALYSLELVLGDAVMELNYLIVMGMKGSKIIEAMHLTFRNKVGAIIIMSSKFWWQSVKGEAHLERTVEKINKTYTPQEE